MRPTRILGPIPAIAALLVLLAPAAQGEPRAVRTRVVIAAPELRNALDDPVIASIEAEIALALSQRCAEKYSYLEWQPLPAGSGASADTLPLLTIRVVSDSSGKARPNLRAQLLYCIDRSHDNPIVRMPDEEVFLRGDDSTPRTATNLRLLLHKFVLQSVGQGVPELAPLHDRFIPWVVIADSLDIADSTRAAPVVLPVQASVLAATEDSRLLVMFCTVVEGDTVEKCRLEMNPVGNVRGFQSCRVVKTQCGQVDLLHWMVAIRNRLQAQPRGHIRVYMQEFFFDRFGGPGGLDHE